MDPDLKEIVASGRLGWQWLDLAGDPYLVVGGRRPEAGPDFYIFFPAGDVAAALTRLWQALLVGGVVLVALAALAARGIARRVLHPVAAASRAAGAIAAGDLSARLPVESGDEFGAWAESFNRMAASLQRSIADLQEARDRERRFVADVSHELRTPLTALVGEASLLKEHLDAMPPEARRMGELLAADTARLRTLVEELLEVSRLDAGSEATSLSEFDAAALAGAVAAARCPRARLEAPGPLPVRSDRRRLERILANLLDNAARHGGGARSPWPCVATGATWWWWSPIGAPALPRGTWSASSSASTRPTPPGPRPAAVWAWPSPAATPGPWAATSWPGAGRGAGWSSTPGCLSRNRYPTVRPLQRRGRTLPGGRQPLPSPRL